MTEALTPFLRRRARSCGANRQAFASSRFVRNGGRCVDCAGPHLLLPCALLILCIYTDTLTGAWVRYEIRQTEVFAAWHSRLRDMRARVAIARRIEQASCGNLGDSRSLGGVISELRIRVGPGYRLYYTLRGRVVLILLCGGDKSTQAMDIQRARRLAAEV